MKCSTTLKDAAQRAASFLRERYEIEPSDLAMGTLLAVFGWLVIEITAII